MLFPPIIADFISSDQQYGIKVTYHALFMCNFDVTDEDYKKIFGKCAGMLCNYVKKSPTNSIEEKLFAVMALRIVGNFIALRTDNAVNELIDQLAVQNETLSNVISQLLKIDSGCKNEMLWLAGNIYQANVQYRNEIVSTLMI